MIGTNPVINTTSASGHFHAVRFYDSEKSLCRIVASFLGEGLATGQSALVVGTPGHRRAIVEELRARHFDVVRMHAAGDLVLVDARKLMSEFMVDGVPDAARFMDCATRVLERAARGRKDVAIRAYGEMVDLLWKDGFDVAAIQLEMLWNRLARTHDFSLLCGYSMGSFYKDACLASISAEHTHIVGADGTAVVAEAGSLTLEPIAPAESGVR
jgi:MEDS: MEthanogen/methylotroph, DcmR Sensory domain